MIIIKLTETSNTGLPGAYKWARRRMRIVLCEEGAHGWLNERSTKLLWQSDHYNVPNSLFGKSNRAKFAQRFTRRAHLLSLFTGLPVDNALRRW